MKTSLKFQTMWGQTQGDHFHLVPFMDYEVLAISSPLWSIGVINWTKMPLPSISSPATVAKAVIQYRKKGRGR